MTLRLIRPQLTFPLFEQSPQTRQLGLSRFGAGSLFGGAGSLLGGAGSLLGGASFGSQSRSSLGFELIHGGFPSCLGSQSRQFDLFSGS